MDTRITHIGRGERRALLRALIETVRSGGWKWKSRAPDSIYVRVCVCISHVCGPWTCPDPRRYSRVGIVADRYRCVYLCFGLRLGFSTFTTSSFLYLFSARSPASSTAPSSLFLSLYTAPRSPPRRSVCMRAFPLSSPPRNDVVYYRVRLQEEFRAVARNFRKPITYKVSGAKNFKIIIFIYIFVFCFKIKYITSK